MTQTYRSTRGLSQTYTASQAILQGLAPDGGLFVPTKFPKLSKSLNDLLALNYQDLALAILQPFLDDFSEAELKACITAAYGKQFDDPAITPIHLEDDPYLELYHGPTAAFKDVALQLLPHLMTTAAKKQQDTNEIAILTATSGDTGKAAMAGFADVPGTRIIVFYPKDGVSPIQKQQMLTQSGDNVHVIGIDGNFDDAQRNVKAIFNNSDIKAKLTAKSIQFSSANSINIGRLVPQIVYYFSAYSQLVKLGKLQAGDLISFSVPTGNFGDILAGWYAKKLGLPVEKLICASNENNILTDFFHTGVYDRNRAFHLTSSPSMDILVSSNLERLLFEVFDEDTSQLKTFMDTFESTGKASLSKNQLAKLKDFVAFSTDETQTRAEIRRLQTHFDYTIDPHTAVATHATQAYLKQTNSKAPVVTLSTANPYKFPETVLYAITAHKPAEVGFDAIRALSNVIALDVPRNINRIKRLPVIHKETIAVDEMSKIVLNKLLNE